MSTRKQFVAMAKSIAEIKPKNKRKQLAEFNASEFAKFNPRFDRARFMAACGL